MSCQKKNSSADVSGLVVISSRSAARVASLRLREPWSGRSGESVVERLVRMVQAAGVRRVVVASLSGEGEWLKAVESRVDRALSPGPGLTAALWSGLRVCLERTAPPSAVLVWPIEASLVDEETLAGLMAEPMLAEPVSGEALWVGWPEATGSVTGAFGVGVWPTLVSASWARRWCRRCGARVSTGDWGRAAEGGSKPDKRRVVARHEVLQRAEQAAWLAALEAPDVLGRRVARGAQESAMWWSAPEVWGPYVTGESSASDF